MRPLLLVVLTLPLLACPPRAGTTAPKEDMQPPAAETNPNTEPLTTDAGTVAVTPEEVPKVARGEACTADAQCAQGLVCEGCTDTDRKCIPGCRTNADCEHGETCNQVQCIRCPCPPLCGH